MHKHYKSPTTRGIIRALIITACVVFFPVSIAVLALVFYFKAAII